MFAFVSISSLPVDIPLTESTFKPTSFNIALYNVLSNFFARQFSPQIFDISVASELQILQAALVCLLVGDHGIVDINIFLLHTE